MSLEQVDLDTLEKLADQSHPLTYEGAGIPVTYCIVPRLDVLDAIAELRASRKVVEAARAVSPSMDDYNLSDWPALLDAALAEYDSLVNVSLASERSDGAPE